MHRILSSLLFLSFIFISCQKDPDPLPLPPGGGGTDSFMVNLQNGYGSGLYKVGDTVHVFAQSYGTDKVFDSWTTNNINDMALLDGSTEWHTWFIMPDRAVSFTGHTKPAAQFNLVFEQIMGRNRLKPVYSYFPTSHKGIVYLLHGTMGTANHLANNFEFQLLIRDLVTAGFAIIITESEESTLGVDGNGDGKIRWAYLPADTVANVDYANIRIITQTFYDRGSSNPTKPLYSIGMSAGGFFAMSLGEIYQHKAVVSYAAQGSSVFAGIATVPTQFAMQRNDNHEEVGQAGNAAAIQNSATLMGRGICSKVKMNQRAPLYPERFARRGDISLTESRDVFNELKSKGYLDAKNYWIGYSDNVVADFQANPAAFPKLSALGVQKILFVLEQVNLSITDHHMYSDYNKASIAFLEMQCG